MILIISHHLLLPFTYIFHIPLQTSRRPSTPPSLRGNSISLLRGQYPPLYFKLLLNPFKVTPDHQRYSVASESSQLTDLDMSIEMSPQSCFETTTFQKTLYINNAAMCSESNCYIIIHLHHPMHNPMSF
jgi:hypothetical protein